jgi:GTP cyclohydrolase I
MLPDTQNNTDKRNIYINQVGIKDIKHPLIYIDKFGEKMHSVGTWQMTVGLKPEVKGTHMSRFIEILNSKTPMFNVNNFASITNTVLQKLEASSARVEVNFPLFINKKAPVSRVSSLMDYDATIVSEKIDDKTTITLKIVIPVTSLCPCSKSIAEYGAHNQRSHITVNAQVDYGISFEDIIALVEQNSSCDLYAILKREDEKFVTEKAYNNPAFVEDLVRDIAIALKNNAKILNFTLESENFESIHNHSAYALITQNNL